MADEPSTEHASYTLGPEPSIVVRYHDQVTAAVGHAVIDTSSSGISFGGVRISRNLKWTDLAQIARSGTIRYQLARVPLGGARLGLDYDPDAPNTDEVLGRFLTSLRGFLESSLSVGADRNVPNSRLEAVLERHGLPWRMNAVQRQQGWPRERWNHYQQLLEASDDEGYTLRDLQVAHSVVEAVLALGNFLFHRNQTIGVIGSGPFGTLIARLLSRRGAAVVAVAGGAAGIYCANGLNPELLDTSNRGQMSIDSSHIYITREELLSMPLDVVLVASGPNVITVENVGRVRATLVVEAANGSISHAAETVLVTRGASVLPNFAVTLGAVLLVNAALQGVVNSLGEALDLITSEVHTTVRELARLASTLRVSLRDAGVRLAFHRWDVSPPSLFAPEQQRDPLEDELPEVI